jgi:hypothetical protein
VVQLQTEFVLDGSTLNGSAADFDPAAKAELVDVIVASVDGITDASQITDLEVFDVVAKRRSLLAVGNVGVRFVVTVEVSVGSDSVSTADALKLSLKTAITSGTLDARLAEAVEAVLVRASTNEPESVAAIDASTFVAGIVPAPTRVPTPAPTKRPRPRPTAAPTPAVIGACADSATWSKAGKTNQDCAWVGELEEGSQKKLAKRCSSVDDDGVTAVRSL